MKNFALVMSCLLLGGFIGYQLRFLQESGASSSDVVQSRVTNASANTSRPLEAKRASGSLARAGTDLRTRMKSLLENYNANAAQKAIGSLSASDIQAALALLVALPESEDRDSLRADLYRAWAKTNPTAAWKAALADPLAGDSGFLLGAVAGELVKTKPEAAVGLALSLGMDSRREEVLHDLFDVWGKDDPAGAVAYWNKHPDLPVSSSAITSAIDQSWGNNPLRAANLSLTLTDLQARTSAISSLMSQWASRDPTTAMSWAETISNPTLRRNAIAEAIRGWSYKDPEAALAHARTIADPGTRSSAMRDAWFNWMRKDPAAAMTHLGSSKDEKLMEMIGPNLLNGSSGFTRQEVESLMEKLPEGWLKQNIVRSLAETQIQKGLYNQAMEVLNNMPDSSARDVTVRRLGETWADADPKAAEEWLKIQPDSSDRDLAVAGFTSVLARTDPQAALQWADTIPDAGVKSGALKNIAISWLAADPVSAEAWLGGTNELSESDKKAVRETVQ